MRKFSQGIFGNLYFKSCIKYSAMTCRSCCLGSVTTVRVCSTVVYIFRVTWRHNLDLENLLQSRSRHVTQTKLLVLDNNLCNNFFFCLVVSDLITLGRLPVLLKLDGTEQKGKNVSAGLHCIVVSCCDPSTHCANRLMNHLMDGTQEIFEMSTGSSQTFTNYRTLSQTEARRGVLKNFNAVGVSKRQRFRDLL